MAYWAFVVISYPFPITCNFFKIFFVFLNYYSKNASYNNWKARVQRGYVESFETSYSPKSPKEKRRYGPWLSLLLSSIRICIWCFHIMLISVWLLFLFCSELEEEEAEERLRKLREEQDQKDRMTLGETREQLRGMEDHLTKLKDEKHQLFLQLKKVLNEDELRRRISNARVDLRYLHFYLLLCSFILLCVLMSFVTCSELSQPYSLVPISAGTGGAGGHQQQLFLQPHNPQSPLPARHLYKVGHLPGGLLPPVSIPCLFNIPSWMCFKYLLCLTSEDDH